MTREKQSVQDQILWSTFFYRKKRINFVITRKAEPTYKRRNSKPMVSLTLLFQMMFSKTTLRIALELWITLYMDFKLRVSGLFLQIRLKILTKTAKIIMRVSDNTAKVRSQFASEYALLDTCSTLDREDTNWIG